MTKRHTHYKDPQTGEAKLMRKEVARLKTLVKELSAKRVYAGDHDTCTRHVHTKKGSAVTNAGLRSTRSTSKHSVALRQLHMQTT